MAKSKSKSKVTSCITLFDLGTTPDGIARKLKKLGIKGDVGAESTCALAKYLVNEFAPDEVSVNMDGVVLEFGSMTIQAKLPPAYSKFVVKFDDEEYPYLVA